ncbi:MAG: ROK family protein, partial [Clostridia bacterium]|nr:ROK family protein [Clostridia bacterium]
MNTVVGNAQLIQKMNRLKVLNFIRRNPNTPRNVIAHKTGLSVASLTNIASYLISKGLLTESGTEKATRVGRKSTLLRFGADAYGLVCISLGVGAISVSYTNLEGKIIESTSVCDDNIQPPKVIELVREYIASLIEKYGRDKILAIGISISGLVLDGSRFVVSSSLKWREFDLKATLEKDTGQPVFVENMS